MVHSHPVTQVGSGLHHTSPAPHPSGATESLISFFKPGFVTSRNNFPTVVSASLWLPVDSCPCKVAETCATWYPALSQLAANVRPGPSPPLLISVLFCILISLYPQLLMFNY